MSYITNYGSEYDGLTLIELYQAVLRALGSPVATPGTETAADFSRYPKVDIIRELNIAQTKFVHKTGCLSAFALIPGVANQMEYQLPKRFMKVLDARYYTSTTEYEQLTLVSKRDEMKRISGSWATDTAGTPSHVYPGIGHDNLRSFGAYPRPSSSGSIATITGTHKAGYANSAFLVDAAGRDLSTAGAAAGMFIFNTTDESSGLITAIGDADATNDKITVTLIGGAENDFDAGDGFTICQMAYNFLIEFARRPLALSSNTDYPEIPVQDHDALIEYAVWKLGSVEYNGRTVVERAQAAKEAWLEAVGDFDAFGTPDLEPDNLIEDREAQYFF